MISDKETGSVRCMNFLGLKPSVSMGLRNPKMFFLDEYCCSYQEKLVFYENGRVFIVS